MLDFWCSMSTAYVVGVRCSALAAALLESLIPFALLFSVLYGVVVLTILHICIVGFLICIVGFLICIVGLLVLDIVHISCVV